MWVQIVSFVVISSSKKARTVAEAKALTYNATTRQSEKTKEMLRCLPAKVRLPLVCISSTLKDQRNLMNLSCCFRHKRQRPYLATAAYELYCELIRRRAAPRRPRSKKIANAMMECFTQSRIIAFLSAKDASNAFEVAGQIL